MKLECLGSLCFLLACADQKARLHRSLSRVLARLHDLLVALHHHRLAHHHILLADSKVLSWLVLLVVRAATAASVVLFTLCSRFDLEFGEIGENFTHGRSSQCEVFDVSLLQKLCALGKHKGQTQVSEILLLPKVHSSNLETSLVSQRFRSFHYRSWSIRVDECNCGIIAICVHKLGFGHSVLHRVDNVLVRVDKILFSLLD